MNLHRFNQNKAKVIRMRPAHPTLVPDLAGDPTSHFADPTKANKSDTRPE